MTPTGLAIGSLFSGIGGHRGRGGRPKVYPEELVERVRSLYGKGLTQDEVASAAGITQKVVWRLMRRHGIVARKAAKREQRGPRNHAWKGGAAKYAALHLRIAAIRGTPARCEACGSDDPAARYEWANITGRYDDPADYRRLCVSCHRRFDAGRRRAC